MRNGYRWVFFSLGVIFILLAAIDDLTLVGETTGAVASHAPKLASIAKDTLLAVGVAILAVSVIDAIWSNLGGDPLAAEIHSLAKIKDLFSDADQTGLIRVHGTVLSSSPKIEWINRIDACKKNIDLVGYQLLDIVDSSVAMNALKAKADSGVVIRVVLPRATMPGLPYAASPGNLDAMKANMTHAISKFKELHSTLNASANFTLKAVNDSMIIDASVRRFDDAMFVINYLHATNTGDSPLFEFRDNGREHSLFRTYLKWFEHTYQSGTLIV
jgi:hypothetical protein